MTYWLKVFDVLWQIAGGMALCAGIFAGLLLVFFLLGWPLMVGDKVGGGRGTLVMVLGYVVDIIVFAMVLAVVKP